MSLKDLKKVLSPAEKLEIGGVELSVHAFSLRDLPRVLDLVSAFYSKGMEKNIAVLVKDNFDSFVEIVSLSVKEKKEDILDKLSIDEFIELALKVVEVNSTVFFQKIVPMIQSKSKAFETMGLQATGHGLSKGLSSEATV